MRTINKMSKNIVYYTMLRHEDKKTILVGPYSKVVSRWPKSFPDHYTILQVKKFNIGEEV